MSGVLGALAAVLVVAAILVLIVALRPAPPTTAAARPVRARRSRFSRLSKRDRTVLLVAAVGGVALYLYTGWIILIVAVPAAAFLFPRLLGTREAKDEVTRLTSLESWVRGLAGVIVANTPLEQAIRNSVANAPAPIAAEVQRLATRIANRVEPRAALRAFADDLGDPTADVVVTHLQLATDIAGPGLAESLTTIADSISEEVNVRRDVDALRAGPIRTMRLIAFGIGGLIAVIALTSPLPDSMFAPYRSAIGQTMLLVWVGVFALAVRSSYQVTKPRPLARLLTGGRR